MDTQCGRRSTLLNLEAYLSEESGARDMATDHGFGRLLDAKVERFTGGPGFGERLVTLETILQGAWRFYSTIEDMREAYAAGGIARPQD